MSASSSTTVVKRLFTYMNCSQATLSTVADGTGIDDRGTVKAAHPFEGGALDRGSTCGVVSGGCLAIALANEAGLASGDPRRRDDVYCQLKQYTTWFERSFGSTLCRERIGTPLTTPGGIATYLFSGRVYTRCARHAGPAAERLVRQLSCRCDSPDPGGGSIRSGFCAGPVLRRIRMETGGGDELLEVISVGLDGGVGLSGGLCGALSGALLAFGATWGIDPGVTGLRGTFRSFFENEYNGVKHADGPGLWSAGRIIERFRKEFGSLECHDIARPFDSVEELETFMGSSSTCDKALDWCAAEGSVLIGRG
jgi:Putative redox-active protein (C_GCAxxG_C_C)